MPDNQTGAGRPKNSILVAEDEEDMRQGLRKSLSKRGHEVDTAEDGVAAMERLAEKDYHVVIADLKMPRADGIEVLRRTRQVRPRAGFIIITGYGTADSAVEAMSLGAFDYIPKPFSMDELASLVDEAAARAHAAERVTPLVTATLDAADVPALAGHLMVRAPVFAPVAKGKSQVFAELARPDAVVLGYTATILPPKKLLLPQEECLINFDRDAARASVAQEAPRETVLFGVHPCDMQGILRLDLAFSEGEAESNYLSRRRLTTVVGVSCVPDDSCFCQVTGACDAREGFDVFLIRIGNRYLVEVLTGKGRKLLEGFDRTREATAEDVAEAEAAKLDMARPRTSAGPHARALPALLGHASEDEYWNDLGRKCLSCGSCSLVCPTCFCFDVADRLSLDLRNGRRLRRWDSCQLEGFAAVATGENFRESREDRARHRFEHKFRYFAEKFGVPMCVGCGRCARACPADVNPAEIIGELAKRGGAALLPKVSSFSP